MASRATRRAAAPGAAGPVEQTRGDSVAMRRLSEAVLPALIARFEASGLGELEVRRGEWRVRLRKVADVETVTGPAPAGRAAGSTTASAGRVGGPSAVPAATHRAALLAPVGPGRGAPSSGAGSSGAGRRMATSPAVGYFIPLEAAAPGRIVRSGDVLGHVDVLGVRQEVVAPSDGAVSRVLAELGQAVEYGQELVRLEAPPRVEEASRDGSGEDAELPLSEA